MSWRKYSKYVQLFGGTASGSLVTYFGSKLYNALYNNNNDENTLKGPSVVWQNNWDCQAKLKTIDNENDQQCNEPQKSRHIIMIRHGEFINYSDGSHHLTERGCMQAQYVGQRLRDMGIEWDNVVASTMTRAQETAKIIIKEINYDPLKLEKCGLLQEGIPILPEPKPKHCRLEEVYHRDGPRIEAAFRRYFFRAPPEQDHDTYLLIIGHANVIRYFICRALQFPPEAWLRITLNHGSITWLTILPTGHVRLRYMGDTGFMPLKYVTYRKPKQIDACE